MTAGARFRPAAAVAALLVACACRKPDAGGGAPSASASAASPPPLDTTWRRDRGEPLGPGDRAPDFEGLAHTGMRVRLSALLDGPVLVYFCPRDARPECTAEARVYRDQWLRLHEVLSMIVGVSADDRLVHRDFATAERLPFLLVADTDGAIARAFGAAAEGGPHRVAFLVGKDGVVGRVLTDESPEARANALVPRTGTVAQPGGSAPADPGDEPEE